MKNNVVLVGPFVGDFKTEIIDFRAYTRWVYEILKPEKMFVSTHSNRSFLYDWATSIPIFEDISRDELNQNGLIHNSISQKDISLITKKIKADVIKLISSNKNLIHINISYTKNSHWVPLYKKMYVPISMNATKDDKILFIPNINEKYATIKEIYSYLSDNFENVVVAGDMKTHLHDKNVMLKNPTYFKDIYYDMVKIISESKAVITPNSHWTLVAQLQNIPVFSWGSVMPQYYNNNVQNMVVPDGISLNYLKSMIQSFIISLNNIK